MIQFKNKRRFAEVIIWLIIIDFTRGYWLLSMREGERTKYTNAYSVPRVTFIEGYNFVTCTLVFLSLCYHCWENFTISQIIYIVYSLSNLLRKQKGADFRGAVTIEVVKVWKLVYFLSLRPRELLIKKSRVVHIREFFTRRVLTVSLLFSSLSCSEWRKDDHHCTHFLASGSWYKQNILSHVPEDAVSPKGV